MIELVAEKPLLLLFLVTGVGYVLDKLKVAGFSLGISAVLFAGLAASAIDERLKLPEIVYELGLVLFVYTIAVASGPGFVSTLKRRGLRGQPLGALDDRSCFRHDNYRERRRPGSAVNDHLGSSPVRSQTHRPWRE